MCKRPIFVRDIVENKLDDQSYTGKLLNGETLFHDSDEVVGVSN